MLNIHKQMVIEVLRKFGTCKVIVEGFSMKPAIRSGDEVTIIPRPPKPKVGTVAAFFNDENLIIHRIVFYKRISTDEWMVWLKGDNYPFSTIKLSYNDILGIVESISFNSIRSFFLLPFLGIFFSVAIGFFGYFKHFFNLTFKHKDPT